MNKILAFLILNLFAFILAGCSLTQEQFEKSHWNEKTQGPIPAYFETKIDILENNMLPDSGAYYIYKPSGVTDKINNVTNKLRRLYAMGFDITMAWYRPPMGGCNKPGSSGFTKTMYPEFFLLRLPEPNESLEKYNFIYTEHVAYLPCPYEISFYHIE